MLKAFAQASPFYLSRKVVHTEPGQDGNPTFATIFLRAPTLGRPKLIAVEILRHGLSSLVCNVGVLAANEHLCLHGMQACGHPFFDELREQNVRLPSGRPVPPLFNFHKGA